MGTSTSNTISIQENGPKDLACEDNKPSLYRQIANIILRDYAIPADFKLDETKIEDLRYKLGSNYSDMTKTLNRFLYNLQYFKMFFKSTNIKWPHERKRLQRKVRIYLHKIFKIAPVFSYQRAKENLKRLHALLDKANFFPQMSSQLAIIIYITDLKDKNTSVDNKLIQKNIRGLCCSSAYAFHMTRNKIGIK